MPALTETAFRRRGFDEAAVILHWQDIVGKGLASVCAPQNLRKDGVLQVRVTPAFALELQHMEPVVLDRLASYFGYRAVKRLVLRQGPMPPRHDRTDQSDPAEPRPAPARAEPEPPALRHALDEVDDDGLRDSLAALGQAIRHRHR